MKLKDYLLKHKLTRIKFAAKLGINRIVLGHYINGIRKTPNVTKLAIEYVTAGEVRREDWDDQA
jgi:DNA-binding transcriptional regulator YdaS (Cro superfamily)